MCISSIYPPCTPANYAVLYMLIWQHFIVENLPKTYSLKLFLLSSLCTRLYSVSVCLLGCSHLTLAVFTVIWLGAMGLGPSLISVSAIIDLCGLKALWGHLAPLPAISGCIERWGHPSAETKGQLQRPPAPFLPPGVPFRSKGAFPFQSLHLLLPFSKQVKDTELVRLFPLISFSILPSRPHAERGWEISPARRPQSHTVVWHRNLLLI